MIPKFRAWHKKIKRMYDVAAIDLFAHKIIVEEDYFSLHEPIMSHFKHISLDICDFILMQLTGLYDKNGKEIWENDIILINHPQDITRDFTKILGLIHWNKDEGGWYHSSHNGSPPKKMWDCVEVLGNYYENPELLELEWIKKN